MEITKKSYSENEKIELEWNNGEGLTFLEPSNLMRTF